MESIELPLILQDDFRTYLFVALPMCVLRTEEKLTPWVYENFVNIKITANNHFIYTGFDFENGGVYEPFVVEQIAYNRVAAKDIVETVYDSLRKNQYCYLFLDEFYLETSSAYHKYHYIHDSLIYGYDEVTGSFLAVAMNHKSTLDTLHYSKETFLQAYESYIHRMYDPMIRSIIFFRLKKYITPYVFSITRFLCNLEEYVYSKDKSQDEFMRSPNTEIKGFGIDSVHYFLFQLKRRNDFNFNVFRAFYFLYEHKKGLLRRFEYINSIQSIPNLQEQIASFRSIVNSYRNLYLLVMKYQTLEQKAAPKETLNSLRNRTLTHLEAAIQMEEYQLRQILGIIQLSIHTHYEEIPLPPNLSIQSEITTKNIDDDSYPYCFSVIYHWKKHHRIHHVSMAKRSNIVVMVPLQHPLLYSTGDENNRENISINLHDVMTDTIEIKVCSYFPIVLSDLGIQIYETNIFKNQKISATSTWKNEDGEIDQDYLPQRAIEDNPTTFWNAGGDWKPGDYLQVELDKPDYINCIYIQERRGFQRIREYTVAYQDRNEQWHTIIKSNESLNGKKVVYHFDTVLAKKVRFFLWKTEPNPRGETDESGLSQFEAYYFPDI